MKHSKSLSTYNLCKGLRKYLEKINDLDIMDVDIPTCFPLVYELNRGTLEVRLVRGEGENFLTFLFT
jgi:bisphosphoglycerate-dependent phosphoglycerate mutase